MDKTSSNSQQSVKGGSSSNGSDKGAKDFGGVQSFKNRSGARRREGSNKADKKKVQGGSGQKQQQFNGDKRPRPRGFGDRGRGTASGTLDMEWDGDLNSIGPGAAGSDIGERKSSKKHNLSHLLNFTLAPRDVSSGNYGGDAAHHNRYRNNNGSKWASRKAHKYSKEQFIQANSQFIVREGRDYAIHASDPDHPVDWDSIEDIRFNCSSASESVCPICLDHPTAAKITRCGHIYCWSCILHYLALGDSKYRKCPICFDWISKQDLKSASSINKPVCRQEDRITMYLMKRKRLSTISIPVKHLSAADNRSEENGGEMFQNLDTSASVSSYQTLLVASPSQVMSSVIARERFELMRQMDLEGDTPEACFIEEALLLLSDREKLLQELVVVSTARHAESDEATVVSSGAEGVGYVGGGGKPRSRYSSLSEEKDDAGSCYYFYQSSDGQHIYLTSVNVRMLVKEYGSLENSPNEIEGKVIEMEWDSMSEDIRKKFRYMRHVPLTCEYKVVELEMKAPLVSVATIESFKEELDRKESNRRRRARDERRRDRNIKREEYKKVYGIYPQPNVEMSASHFPVYGEMMIPPDSVALRSLSPSQRSEDSFEPSTGYARSLVATPDSLTEQSNISTTPAGADSALAASSSFAQMLRHGAKVTPSRPQWGPASSAFSAVESRQIVTVSEEHDELVAKPLHQYSLSDAFAAALTMGGQQKKGKKKKRGQQQPKATNDELDG